MNPWLTREHSPVPLMHHAVIQIDLGPLIRIRITPKERSLTDSELLKQAESLYRQLYSSCSPQELWWYVREHLLSRRNTVMLDEQGQNECEGLLTEVESLKSMESNKSPGSDGLPAEFYKVFWNDVHHYLLRASAWETGADLEMKVSRFCSKSVHNVVMWTYVICQSFSFNDLFPAEFWISAPQGSSKADFQCNFGHFSISLLATYN